MEALAATDPLSPWQNTYGIWGRELDALGLGDLLGHRWSDCVADFGAGPLALHHDYGLFDRQRLQRHWLEACAGQLRWHRGQATAIRHESHSSVVTTAEGTSLTARLVVDASGHAPVFVRRPERGPVAQQAAFGLVGRFSADPVAEGQFVLMDYRNDHLKAEERLEPPTFLYAMDLGQGEFFVEETSLALAPPLSFDLLERRLHQRLAHRGIRVEQVRETERCLFPMTLPLPDLTQQVVGFGGAASMVHPASGYMVGGLLRRAPGLAAAIAAGLANQTTSSREVAQQAWQTLWSAELVRKQAIYRFGLEKLMRFSHAELCHFFDTFFHLPQPQWTGFLANTLTVPQLVQAMLGLFGQAPSDVRLGLMLPQGKELALAWRALAG